MEIITTAPRGEYIATAEDGDAKGLVAKVSAEFPYPHPLPVPAGLEAVAHPVMGW